MTESPIHLQTRRVHMEPACTASACQQGRKQCPCPEACGIPPPDGRSKKTNRYYPARILAIVMAMAGAWLLLK